MYKTIRVSPEVKLTLQELAKRDGRTEGAIVADMLPLYKHVYKTPRPPIPSKAGRPKKVTPS
jgi:hypothetical protein